MFCFPFFQGLLVATFGFDDFTSVRVFVDLHLTRLASARFCLDYRGTTTSLRIEQIDHVLQAVAVLAQQRAQFGLKFNFFLQAVIAFQGFESLKLLSKVFFKLAEFCEFGHGKSHM